MDTGLSLVDLSIDELYVRLADEAVAGGLPLDPDHRRQIGMSVFAGWMSLLKDAICAADLMLTNNPDRETAIRDAAAVADVISALGLRMPVFTLAFIIVRHGIHHICGQEW